MEYPRIGEALVRGEKHRLSTAEPELIIGDLNGPVLMGMSERVARINDAIHNREVLISSRPS